MSQCNEYVPVYTCMYLNLTLKELKLPIQGPIEDAGVVNRPRPRPVSLRGTWWAESPSSPAFWMATRLRQSLTSTARTRIYVSRINGRRGSNVYEVKTWLWQFGRGKPHLGGLTIEATTERQDAARKVLDKRWKETCEGRKGDCA